jgi:DNA-binding transcriptional MerR regulator
MMRLLEAADAARALNVVPATVRALARAGSLRIAATTPRGTRLFRARDVERLRRAREARQDVPKREKKPVIPEPAA